MATIEEQFTIINIKDGIAYLQAIREDGCGGCSANKGCGVGSLNRYFAQKLIKHPVEKSYKIGDIITLNINANTLLFHAFLLYLVPLLVLFMTAYVAKYFFPTQDLYQVIFGLLGLVMSFLILKFWL